MGSNKSPLESLVSLQDYLRVRVRSATERDAAGEWRDIEIGKALDAGVNGGPGNVLRYGADPTGVADSTAAFQAAIDSEYGVYVPYGKYRIDGTLTIDKEKTIQCERGIVTPGRYFTKPLQWPFDFSTESRVHLFKDNDSDNSPFFKIHWARVSILGYPMLSTFERDTESFTSEGVLYAINEGAPQSVVSASTGWVRGSQGWLEIMAQGNADKLTDAGEGMRAIRVAWGPTSLSLTNGYLTDITWNLYAFDVHSGLMLEEFAEEGQWANTLYAEGAIWNAKSHIVNRCFNVSEFHFLLQAANTLDPTEFPTPMVELGPSASRCFLNCMPYDLNSEADADGHYRQSYFLKNLAKGTRVTEVSPTNRRSVVGYLPTGQNQVQYSPTGVIPHINRKRSPQDGMVMLSLYNVLHNLKARCSSFSVELYSGVGIETTTAVSDAVFSNASGSSVDITSALGELPSLAVGAQFVVTDHSEHFSNGTYQVTAVITGGYTCDKIDASDGTPKIEPVDATAEAITVATGFGAMVTDSVTEGVSTSANWSGGSALENVAKTYTSSGTGTTFTADAVTDGDYVEFHFTTDFTYKPQNYFFSLNSNGGFQQMQVIQRNSGSFVGNALKDTASQQDEDATDIHQLDATASNTTETIVRFIKPNEGVKSYTFEDFAAIPSSDDISSEDGHYLSKQGDQEVLGSLTFNGGGWNEAHIVLGTNHIWVDSTGDARIKSSAPTSDTDGTVIGSQV